MSFFKRLLGSSDLSHWPTTTPAPAVPAPKPAKAALLPQAELADTSDPRFPLVLLGPTPQDWWTVADSFEGTIVFGATGAGKTSGPGRCFGQAFLQSGWGGLILCAKTDERETWEKYAKECGREGDVLVFSPKTESAFNFLQYELQQPGFSTFSLVNTLMQLVELSSRKHGNGKGDDFWEKAMRQLLTNAVELCVLSSGGQGLEVPEIIKITHSSPKSIAEARSDQWQRDSHCAQLLAKAKSICPKNKEADLLLALNYFCDEFANLSDKTRSIIVSSLTSLLDNFLRYPLRGLFATGTTMTPDDILSGKILICDVSVKEYGDLGQYANVLWKFAVQKAAERKKHAPLFIWGDEAQYFITAYDQIFATTARSSKTATVYLTQNVPNLHAELGGDSSGKSRVESLLGNLQTRIFTQNAEPETNKWMAEVIGRDLVRRNSGSGSSGWTGQLEAKLPGWNVSSSSSYNEQIDYLLQPVAATTLLKGGQRNQCIVSGIVTQSGRVWGNGKPFMLCLFPQFDMRGGNNWLCMSRYSPMLDAFADGK